jgi:hypothetical protein
MRFRVLLWLAALMAWPISTAHAQIRSLTVGVHTTCPYGLVG